MNLEDVVDGEGPFFIMLVGLPGVGKSTFCRRIAGWTRRLSTDDYVEHRAHELGLTYNDVWEDYVGEATKKMMEDFKVAVTAREDIVVDRTNTSAKRRKGMLAQLPKAYRTVAIVFPTPEKEEWMRRLDRPGKTVPPHALDMLEKSFSYPTLDEGWDNILEWNS